MSSGPALATLHAETGSQFKADGTFGWACYLLLALFACGLVARAQERAADTRGLLIPILAVAPYALVVFWLAGDTALVAARPVDGPIGGRRLPAGVDRENSARRLRIRPCPRGARGDPARHGDTLDPRNPELETRLWVADDTQDEQDSDDAAEEEPLLYDQPSRIAAAVERVAPSEGKPAVFFVGFAGNGDQNVFKREAVFAQSVFADHFGSADRSMELINDVDDRDSYPLATVSGLTDGLRLLAGRMNPNEDVLVLTLTSHGSREGLEVTNGSMPLLQLGPTELRQALDESGIKWRVLIVSACYSGAFSSRWRPTSLLSRPLPIREQLLGL